MQGAILFAETKTGEFEESINFLIVPCISPRAYDTINRMNPEAMDPNRCCTKESTIDETRLLMTVLENFQKEFNMHIDLHETTDSDESEFRPTRAARDGVEFRPDTIKMGFTWWVIQSTLEWNS